MLHSLKNCTEAVIVCYFCIILYSRNMFVKMDMLNLSGIEECLVLCLVLFRNFARKKLE